MNQGNHRPSCAVRNVFEVTLSAESIKRYIVDHPPEVTGQIAAGRLDEINVLLRTSRIPGIEADPEAAIETLMDDVAGLIDAAGAREVMLLAHDWGAMTAWQFAAHRVRPLERLVILNGPPPGAGVRPRPSIFSRQFWRSFYVFVLQLPRLPEAMFRARDYRMIEGTFRGRMTVRKERFPDDVVAVYKEAAARPGALTGMIHYYRALVRGGGIRRIRAAGGARVSCSRM